MPRYIDADKLKESLKKLKAKGYNQKYVQGLQDAIDGYFPQIIDDAPTADVQPVKHGRWIDFPECLEYEGALDEEYFVCSQCHYVWNTVDNCAETFICCPNCGSKNRMDGDSE